MAPQLLGTLRQARKHPQSSARVQCLGTNYGEGKCQMTARMWGWEDAKEGGMGNCCPLQFCPGMWRVPAGSVEKAATAMGSCTAPVPAWFPALTRHDPVAHRDGRWFPLGVSPPMHTTVMLPEGWVGPGNGHSTGSIPAYLQKRVFKVGGPGSRRPRRGVGRGHFLVGPFPALSSLVDPGAGGHRRELGSFLRLLLGGQWPGVGDSHTGPGCKLLLGAGAAPHGQTTACGTQDALGREQEPSWSRGGCLHPQGSPHLISSSCWVMGPQCRRAAGAVACSHRGTSRAGEWHVPMAGTSPFESSASARHMVSLSPPSNGRGHLGDPDAQLPMLKGQGSKETSPPNLYNLLYPRNLDLPSFPSP